MGGSSNQPTSAGDEQESVKQPQPKPEERRKVQPMSNPNVARVPNPNAELNRIVLDAVQNAPNMGLIKQAAEELGRTQPELNRNYARASKDLLGSVTSTTTINPGQNIRYSALEAEEGQSKKIEELNDRVNKALEEVKKLVAGASEDVHVLKNDVESLRTELEKSQLKLIETLGLFVAVFGYIIVASSAFKDIRNAKVLAGLLMVAAGMIMLFVVVLDLLVRRWHYELSIDEVGWKKTLMRWIVPQGIVLAVVAGLSVWGVHLLSGGNKEVRDDPAKAAATASPTPLASPSTAPSPTPALNSQL